MKISENLPPGDSGHGKLLLVESVLKPSDQPYQGRFNDITMLLVGGRERTEGEFNDLLHKGALL